MMQSNYKHWNYIFCGHESFEFLLYKPWLTWFLWIWASWVEGSFLLGIQCSLSGLVNHDPPVTLGHMLPFFVLNWWCHQVFPLGSCAWLPTFCSSAGFGKLWRCFYSSLGNETCDIIVGVPMHICDLHLGGAKDAGHIVLDMNVWPVKER